MLLLETRGKHFFFLYNKFKIFEFRGTKLEGNSNKFLRDFATHCCEEGNTELRRAKNFKEVEGKNYENMKLEELYESY